jgi:4-hydroxy-2-oxoheptanedioate aldolase
METKRDSSERSVEDRFRQAARDSRTLFCAWLSINSPLLIEAIGVAGWDCILIDQQHGLGGHDAMIGCLPRPRRRVCPPSSGLPTTIRA